MRRDPHGYVVLDSTGKGASAFEGLRVDDAGEFDQRLLPYLVESAGGPRTPDLRACRDSAGNRLALRALQLRLWRTPPTMPARPATLTGSDLPVWVRLWSWSRARATMGNESCAGRSARITWRSICTSSSRGWPA
jgi:hypothetical protein